MIKIMLISNMEKFIDKVQSCKGDVMLCLNDGSECNLKTDHQAQQMLKMFYSENEELDLRLTESRDLPVIMSYMMNAAA